MPNKHRVKGKFNEVVGNITDDKAKKYKGMTQNKFGEIQDKATHMTDREMDMDEKSMFSVAIGVVLILSGLYFVMRAKDDLF